MSLTQLAYTVQYDPMAPPGYGVKVKDAKKIKKEKIISTHYVLRQIVLNDRGNRAVINDDVVKVGSYVDRAKVIKIEADKVILSRAGKYQTLTLDGKIIKVRH